MGSQHCIEGEADQAMVWVRNIVLGEGGSSYVMGSQHCIGEEGDQAMLWARNIILGERRIKLC